MNRSTLQRLRTQLLRWFRRSHDIEKPPSPSVPAPSAVRSSLFGPMPSPPGRVGPAQLVRGHVLLPAESAAPWLLLPRQRHYRLFVPSRAADDASPLPLVVMIHGCRQDAESFARGTRMDELAETHGFAVLYPEQAQLANVRRCWNWFEAKTASGAGECELVLEMIREASRKAAIADRKVFVAGLSSGGALAALLAFHHPERFQAVAVHSGLPPVWPISATLAFTVMKRGPEGSAQAMAERFWQQPHRRGMRLTGPPPLLVLHGDADTRVSEVNAGALVTLWRSILELAPEAAGPIEKRSSTHAAQAGMRAYTQTDYLHNGRLFLRGIRIHGLAHAWSGGDAREPFFDACGPEASALIWAFFEKQRQAHKPSVNV